MIAIVVMQVAIGRGLNRLKDHLNTALFSVFNLLAFALVRPEGAHAITDNGLSALLRIFGIDWGYRTSYDSYIAVALAILQVVLQIKLYQVLRSARSNGA